MADTTDTDTIGVSLDWGRAFVHGNTFLHSWSGPMILVVGLLQGATLLSNLTLVLFVSFIRP